MSEAIIFWLVPVFLLVLFSLLIANHNRDPKRKKLLFVEPLGTLISRWRVVRMIGDTAQLRQCTTWLEHSLLSDETPLELVLRPESGTDHPSISLLQRESIGGWAEQRVLQRAGRTVSIIAGDVDSVLSVSRYRSDGRVLLTESDKAEYRLTAARAGEHGYLALALASRYFHSRTFEREKHTWLGIVLLEPIYDNAILAHLRGIEPSRLKLLSVLPEEFLHAVVAALRGSSKFAGIPRRQSDSPIEEERIWQESSAIGGVDVAKRHAIIRFFESRRDCRMLSVLPIDKELPIRIHRTL